MFHILKESVKSAYSLKLVEYQYLNKNTP